MVKKLKRTIPALMYQYQAATCKLVDLGLFMRVRNSIYLQDELDIKIK
ncbi:hypothetical protein [Paenibacillus amylolyticus]